MNHGYCTMTTILLDKFSLSDIYAVGAVVIGGLTFIVSWAYCVATYGFLLGFCLGWIPSAILATILGALWPLVVIALIATIVLVMHR
jgi:hypothetical protein